MAAREPPSGPRQAASSGRASVGSIEPVGQSDNECASARLCATASDETRSLRRAARPAAHCFLGREPGVRQRAIGSRLAPASVGRQQRRRRDQAPCIEQRPRPCLTIGCGASRSRGHPRLRSAWCRPASRSQRMRSRRKLCSQANEDHTSARGRVPSRGRCSGGRSPVSRLGATARDGTCRGHGRDRRSQSENGDLVAERRGQPTCGAAPPAMRIAMATDEKADDPRHLP